MAKLRAIKLLILIQAIKCAPSRLTVFCKLIPSSVNDNNFWKKTFCHSLVTTEDGCSSCKTTTVTLYQTTCLHTHCHENLTTQFSAVIMSQKYRQAA